MKHLILAITLFTATLANSANASNADLFIYDNEQVTVALSQASEIENYVTIHNDISLTNLQADKNLSSKLNLENFSTNTASFTFDDMNWKAFAWGFCCWPIGIFTVLIKDESTREDKISFLIGAVIAFVGWGGGWRFYYL